MKKWLEIVLTLSFLFIFAMTVFAAENDSGAILRQQEQLKTPSLRRAPEAVDGQEAKKTTDDSSIIFTVKSFDFQGYEKLILLTRLQSLSAPYLNKKISFDGLEALILKINDCLRKEKGYLLARAYLPKQDITAGTVTIMFTATRLDGKAQVAVDGPSRIKTSYLDDIAARAVTMHEVISLGSLERAVLLIDDLPGITARAYLDKGSAPGTTHLSIRAQEGPLFSAALSGDNFGNRYTGAFRRNLRAALNDALGCGDYLQLTYINSDNLNQGALNASLPLGPSGLAADISYAGLRYELGDKLKDLGAKGFAHNINTGLRYPLLRTRAASLWLGSGYEFYALKDRALNSNTSARDVHSLRYDLSGNFYDAFFHGGLSSIQFSVNTGNTAVNENKSDDDRGARNDGNFVRFSYALARLQSVSDNISLFFSLRGQAADGNLDSSQKMILGGPTGVRAYPVGEASGDEGCIVTVEKRYDLPFDLKGFKVQLIDFIDVGHITLHKRNWTNAVTNISGKNRYWLAGIGPGINLEKGDSFKVQFSYAHRIGKNIGRDINDKNADNRKNRGRFWLQAAIWF